MSTTIPTKQIDGDVAIGRNVTIGGKAAVRGSATIGHNLKVEGWLDAPNVKGPNKGLFKTALQLREAHPTPHEGWWALVGDTLPAQVYMAIGGAWVAQVNADNTPKLAGNPTIDSSEYMQAVEDLSGDLDAVKKEVIQNAEDIRSLRSNQTTQGNQINNLQTSVQAVQGSVEQVRTAAGNAQRSADAAHAAAAEAMTAAQAAQSTADTKFPADRGAAVEQLAAGVRVFPFDAICYHAESELADSPAGTIAFCSDTHIFRQKQAGGAWSAAYTDYLSEGAPRTDCIYRMGNKLYAAKPVSGAEYLNLVEYVIGLGDTADMAFPGDRGKTLEIDMKTVKEDLDSIAEYHTVYNISALSPDSPSMTKERALQFAAILESLKPGDIIIYDDTTDGWTTLQYTGSSITDEDSWTPIGGATVGNTYNVTAEVPTSDPDHLFYHMNDPEDAYYAPSVVLARKKAMLGLQITFAIAKGAWKTYQYVGTDLKSENVLDPDNWLDLAGMSAGSEPFVNINQLCGQRDYTLSLAIKALIDLRTSSGIDYLKEGMVITYRRSSDPDVWETKQFHGKITDLTPANESLWSNFGSGGGSDVKTSDTTEENGKDAFSTGGAYEMEKRQFGGLELTPDAENYVIQATDRKGDPLGDPVKIPVSNGGGQQRGSTLTIYCDQAVRGAFGSTLELHVALKSVSYDGDTELLGTIDTIGIIDPATGITLWSEKVNEKSSTSSADTKFVYPFTDLITEPESRDYTIFATDKDGNRRTRGISVSAVDVTVECVHKLQYTTSDTLTVGGDAKRLSMYKFSRNVGKEGIEVVTEMFYGDEWRELGKAVVRDNYTQVISIDPKNVFGNSEQLTHGGYLIRMHGKDISSGVTGNTVYTTVMCVEPGNTTPIAAIRWDDRNNGSLRLYDTLKVAITAYTPGQNETVARFIVDGHTELSRLCGQGEAGVINITKQIQGYPSDGTKSLPFHAEAGEGDHTATSAELSVTIKGSAIAAQLKEGAEAAFDFSNRDNSETDHSINNNGHSIIVTDANWSSNGFIEVLGEKALADVNAESDFAPFADPALETGGMALQMAFSTKNIRDKSAHLCECMSANGLGFYITGNEMVVTLPGGSPVIHRVKFRNREKVTLAIVVEPGSKKVTYTDPLTKATTDYAMVKMYVDGEPCGAIGYRPGTGMLRQNSTIKWVRKDGYFAMNHLLWYTSYMERDQAFDNYLCMRKDTTAMIAEYEREDVLKNGMPSIDAMQQHKIPYYVVVAPQEVFDMFDNGTNTSEKFTCDLYYFNPLHPEVSFHATNVQWRRQGTTSAQRPVKNDRFYLNKPVNKDNKIVITLLNPDENTELGRKAILAAKHNKVYVSETGMFVDVVTVKVDYSDSSNANDCGVCDLMNATFRAMGSEYMTPAQRAFDGTQRLGGEDILTGLQLDHSTKNHPIAAFRATNANLADAWFHAKGNWKEDKGEQVALGFKDVPGYNLGCLNYGDFIEFFGWANEDLDGIEERFRQQTDLDTSKPYVLSLYCGRDYRVMRYINGGWQQTTGSMKQIDGKWVVTGDVLNPVSGYELLQYQGMCWWDGVNTVADMMAPTTQKSSWVSKLGDKVGETVPAWTFYFECMIDDDQLALDLANGRKVPYELYNLLTFFGSVRQTEGTGWSTKWKQQAWRYLSVESAMAYTAFTDYLAAVDQRAKNMQPMFFLEDGASVENGHYANSTVAEPVRMYLNKVYDCDTCNGVDNDGLRNLDPEIDPNKMDDPTTGYENPYMGKGSILFCNMDASPELWTSDDGATILNLKGVIGAMRSRTAQIDGRTLIPFSPEGAQYFFVDKRLMFWQKKISAYDGQRKYIDATPRANRPYFYALYGLGLTSLPQFIAQRWAIRDGYYQTGAFFADPMTIRMATISEDSTISITAAGTGYFGIGNDAGQTTSKTVFLEAGDTHVFAPDEFAHGQAEIRIYQPGRIREIDLSEVAIANGDPLSKLTLCERLTLGGLGHTNPATGFGSLAAVNLGEMPFLEDLDVSYTTATSIDASGCPRLKHLYADNTALTECKVAQTAPIVDLTLPASISRLELVNLPELTYPGGLVLAGTANIARLWVEGCPQVDGEQLLRTTATNGTLHEVRLSGLNAKSASSLLRALKTNGAVGLDAKGNAYAETGRCSGLSGRWIFTDLISEDDLAELSAYYPLLSVYNSQYSVISFCDIAENGQAENITNMDDRTGYLYNNTYTEPAHWRKIEELSHTYRCIFDSVTGVMHRKQLSDASYLKYADGTDFDPTDPDGVGFDVMKDIYPHWRKGINDYKNNVKYTCLSVNNDEPLSTASKRTIKRLADIVRQRRAAVLVSLQTKGQAAVISDESTMDTYVIDVKNMKQVRWPGVNSEAIGAVFVDANDVVIGTFIMNNTAVKDFDFMLGDYVFTDVPEGAEKLIFTSPQGYDEEQAIAIDSSEIEAIEPEWIRISATRDNPDIREMVGVYPLSLNGTRARSVSGATPVRGGNEYGVNSEWSYGKDGMLTNVTIPTTTMKPSGVNLINLCEMRGKGFCAADYVIWCDASSIVYGIIGTRDVQAACGNGAREDYGIGGNAKNSRGNKTTYLGNGGGNLIFGIQDYYGVRDEWMANVAINTTSYAEMRRQKYAEIGANDYKWHIFDPLTKTERVVQGVVYAGTISQYVARVRHGKYCDMVPASTNASGNSSRDYCDTFEFPQARSRVPLRGGNQANAGGGLVCSRSNYAPSFSCAVFGSRLAFRGVCVDEDA